MNKILWIDKDNMLVRLEAGIVGSALERKVRFKVATPVDLSHLSHVAAGGVWGVHRPRARLAGVQHCGRMGGHSVCIIVSNLHLPLIDRVQGLGHEEEHLWQHRRSCSVSSSMSHFLLRFIAAGVGAHHHPEWHHREVLPGTTSKHVLH